MSADLVDSCQNEMNIPKCRQHRKKETHIIASALKWLVMLPIVTCRDFIRDIDVAQQSTGIACLLSVFGKAGLDPFSEYPESSE